MSAAVAEQSSQPLDYRQWGLEQLEWGRRPRWTTSHLRAVVAAGYGVDSLGRPRWDLVAEALGVAESTARRWGAGPPRRRAQIPAARLARLMLPPIEDERRRLQRLEHSQSCLDRVRAPRGRRIDPMWRSRGWLEPHVLLLVQTARGQLVQGRITRIGSKGHATLLYRRPVIAATNFSTAFAAQVMLGQIVEQAGPWRVYPSGRVVTESRQQCWLPEAGIAL